MVLDKRGKYNGIYNFYRYEKMKTAALYIIAFALVVMAMALYDIADSLRIVNQATGRALIFDFSGGKHGKAKATRSIEK